MLMTGCDGVGLVAPPPSTTTWDSSNPGAHITFAGLTVNGDGTANASRALSVGKVAQGNKGKFEWTPNYTDASAGRTSVGFAFSGAPDNWIGQGGYVNGAASFSGVVYRYGVGNSPPSSGNGIFTSGSPLAFLCDNSTPASPVMYITDGTTTWGPFELKPSSDQYAYFEAEASQAFGGTANFGASAYAISNPGYGNLA